MFDKHWTWMGVLLCLTWAGLIIFDLFYGNPLWLLFKVPMLIWTIYSTIHNYKRE